MTDIKDLNLSGYSKLMSGEDFRKLCKREIRKILIPFSKTAIGQDLEKIINTVPETYIERYIAREESLRRMMTPDYDIKKREEREREENSKKFQELVECTISQQKRYEERQKEIQKQAYLEAMIEFESIKQAEVGVNNGEINTIIPDNNHPINPEDPIKPWVIHDPRDPKTDLLWYTAARYFTRQLVKDDSNLLTKKDLLERKVVLSLNNAGVKTSRNGKFKQNGTIKKAWVGIALS